MKRTRVGAATIVAVGCTICVSPVTSEAISPAVAQVPDFDLPPGFANSPLGLNARFGLVAPNFDRALASAVSDCMSGLGVEYTGDPLGMGVIAASESSVEQIASRRYTPPEQVNGTWGYVFDDVSDDGVPDAPLDELTDEQVQALWGERSEGVAILGIGGEEIGRVAVGNGCVAAGVETILGSVEEYTGFIQVQSTIGQIDNMSLDNLMSDPEALAIAEPWRSCMAAAGYDQTQLPFMTANGDFPSPRPGQAEQEIALRDASCRAETNIDQLLLAYEADYSTGVAQDQDPGLLTRASTWLERVSSLAPAG